jgi:hypothetical protein
MSLLSFYDLPHIFVVFCPGGSGNFISGLLNKILNENLSELEINKDGSSHTVKNNILSFGNTYEERFKFNSDEEREKYYIRKIEEEYSEVNVPIVTWSHDFTNINIYKKYFKNSKVICITQENDNEHLSCILMNVLKVILNDPKTWPIDNHAKKLMYRRFKYICLDVLKKNLKFEFKHLVYDIFENRQNNQEYKDLITFAIINGLLKYYQISKRSTEIEINSPTDGYIPGVGFKNLNFFIKNADVTLPYNYLVTQNYELLTLTIEKIIRRTLSHDEKSFVDRSFKQYLDLQNRVILDDPVDFYKSIKKKCQKLIVS